MSVSEKVKAELEPILNADGIELFDVTYKKEGKDYFLRILIDRMDGAYLDLDMIVNVSEKISSILDEKDLITTNYMLDIASVGAEKPLKVELLEKYINQFVNLKLDNAVDGLNELEGTLESVKDDIVTINTKIKTRSKSVEITKSNIKKARLAINFQGDK